MHADALQRLGFLDGQLDMSVPWIVGFSDERLADIAERCGFSSQASMAKAFKSQGKEAPSRYR